MSSDERFSVLMVLLAAVLSGVGWMARALWKVTRQWIVTGIQLESLTENIRGLVDTKERDHARLAHDTETLTHRLERHEDWHANHQPRTS